MSLFVHGKLGGLSKKANFHLNQNNPFLVTVEETSADPRLLVKQHDMERGRSVVECRTRTQVSTGSNPPLLPFRRLGIFVLSIDAQLTRLYK